MLGYLLSTEWFLREKDNLFQEYTVCEETKGNLTNADSVWLLLI